MDGDLAAVLPVILVGIQTDPVDKIGHQLPQYLFSYSLKCDKCRSVEYQQVFGGKISRVNFLPVRDAIISARTRNSPRAYIQAWPLECRVDFYNWVQANCL